jgi:hypothetical protein
MLQRGRSSSFLLQNPKNNADFTAKSSKGLHESSPVFQQQKETASLLVF